jgi:DNA-binding transcriptional LysR family regulator
MKWTDRIGRHVKLRDLHILLALSETGSMVRAAEALAISQPVISKTISDLEHALGVRLLDRNSQGVEPTVYGRAFIDCGRAVYDELRRGVQAVEFLSNPTSGEVRIGGAQPFVDELIPAVTTGLAGRYPQIKFYVIEDDTPGLCRSLRERKLDLVIGRISTSMFGDDLASETLFEDRMFVVAGASNPLSRRRRIELAALCDEPWVVPESDNLGSVMIEEGFRSVGVAPPTPQVVTNSIIVRTRLVETGRFLTMLPGSMLYFSARRLRMKKLAISTPMKAHPVQIISLKNRTPNPISKLFIDELRRVVRPLTKGNNRSASLN